MKAFDSIEWVFLFKTLSKFNLGEGFQNSVKLLDLKPSEEVSVTIGIRQLCPVSALLFILCMEVLSSHIRQNEKITGLNLNKHCVKIIKVVQYADDTTVFVRNT